VKIKKEPGAMPPPSSEPDVPGEVPGEPDLLDTVELAAADDEADTAEHVEVAGRAEASEASGSSGSGVSGGSGADDRAEADEVDAVEPEAPSGPLLFDAGSYQDRWDAIQIGFVDEPLYAVESAGRLLAEVLGEVASSFASKRKDLEAQWRHDREVTTEDLRQAFRGYRAFFQRVIKL
jgi:hypothetical protein